MAIGLLALILIVVLAGLVVAILRALWFFVVARMIRAGVWGEGDPAGSE